MLYKKQSDNKRNVNRVAPPGGNSGKRAPTRIRPLAASGRNWQRRWTRTRPFKAVYCPQKAVTYTEGFVTSRERFASAYSADTKTVFPLATHDLIPGLIVAERRCHVSPFFPHKKLSFSSTTYIRHFYLYTLQFTVKWAENFIEPRKTVKKTAPKISLSCLFSERSYNFLKFVVSLFSDCHPKYAILHFDLSKPQFPIGHSEIFTVNRVGSKIATFQISPKYHFSELRYIILNLVLPSSAKTTLSLNIKFFFNFNVY